MRKATQWFPTRLVRLTVLVTAASLMALHSFLLSATGAAASNKAHGRNTKVLPPKPAAAPQASATQGQWESVRQLPVVPGASEAAFPVHISLLPSGKLLFWGRDKSGGNDIDGGCKAYLWDPLYDTFKLVSNGRTNLFCSGHCFLPDGRLFVAGGHEIRTDNNGVRRYDLQSAGSHQTNYFNYVTETWSPGPDMNLPRWYPSVVTLSNGETQIVLGNYINGFSANNSPLGGDNTDLEFLQSNGTLRNTPGGFPRSLPNYPYLHIAPDGRLIVISGTTGSGLAYDPATGGFNTTGVYYLNEAHDQATTAMYDKGKVLVIGGRQYPPNVINRVEIADLNQPPPPLGQMIWSYVTPMNFQRYYATSVVMPDGKVFVSGGTRCPYTNNIISEDGSCTNGAIMNPEIYEPPSMQFPGGRWSIMAAHQVVRLYHSVALLLPDGRILVGGGGRTGAYGENNQLTYDPLLAHTNWEIFKPPYLFNMDGSEAKRPAITNAPSRIAYGQSFNVGVGNIPASQMGQVALVRLGSVTHTQNFDQRRVLLAFTAQGEYTLNVTAPANGGECPPGPYMLFVLNQSGTPSIAKIIFIGNTALSTDSATFPASRSDSAALTGSVQVKVAAGASWQVTGVPSWVTITSGMSGTGNGTVNFTVQDNASDFNNPVSLRPRSATLLIAGKPFTIYQGAEFADVAKSNGFHDFIGKLYARGITGGCDDPGPSQLRSYCPGTSITRQEMAVFVIRAMGIDPPFGRPNPFNDVDPNSPYYRFIVDMFTRGLTSGCGTVDPTTGLRPFCPVNNVSRAEMAVFIERAIGVTSPPTGTPQLFSDVTTGSSWGWAYDYINDIGRRGITGGCGAVDPMTGLRPYCPGNSITRGEMAVFMTVAFGY